MFALRIFTAFAISIVFCLISPPAAHAAESYDNCTGFITSVPATITTQGTWCMSSDLATGLTSGNAISIDTNNVTINCNDFKLGGLSAGLGTLAYGMRASNRLNVTVRNCNIRGFYIGVDFFGGSSGGHAVEDSRFDGNTYEAIDVTGDGSVIRRNRVSATGGGTVNSSVYAINSYDSVDILDNTVSGTVARATSNGAAYGIFAFGSDASVRGNRVRGTLKDGTGVNYGIFNASSLRVIMRDNEVVGVADVGSIGLRCTNANGSAADNTISGFETAISGCANDGGNVIKP